MQTAILIALSWTFPASPAPDAEDDWRERWDATLLAGVALPGTINASLTSDFAPRSTLEIDSGWTPFVKLTGDFFIYPWLGPTLTLHYAPIRLQEEVELGTWDGREHNVPADGIHMLEVDAGVKARFFVLSSLSIEPSLTAGFRRTMSSSPDARESGFALNASVEVQAHLSWLEPVLDVGCFSQPYGGVKDVAYVRAGPIFYLAVGAGF